MELVEPESMDSIKILHSSPLNNKFIRDSN